MNWQQRDSISKNNKASHLMKAYYVPFNNHGFNVTQRKDSYFFKIAMKYVNHHILMRETVLLNFVSNVN